jgi:RIO kinase 2
MKLDGGLLRYLTREDIRVLTAIEMGMKNHELVPPSLIESIAKLKRGGTFKVVTQLLKYKLIRHENQQYDGYTLTYQGYDILALHTFIRRGHLRGIGSMIGTGKESDIYLCQDNEGNEVVIKLARLGRTSFRAVKSKRDYLKNRHKSNWLFMSRLAAVREYTFMQELMRQEFPVPTPIDHNRHAILMSLVPGYTLTNITALGNPQKIYDDVLDLAVRLAENGLVHSDFNEFNIMVTEDEQVIVIDFPQMVSVDHFNAEELFDRDMQCLKDFFEGRFHVQCDEMPRLSQIVVQQRLDDVVKASGYARQHFKPSEFDLFITDGPTRHSDDEDQGDQEDEEAQGEDQAAVELSSSSEEEKGAAEEDKTEGTENPSEHTDPASLEKAPTAQKQDLKTVAFKVKRHFMNQKTKRNRVKDRTAIKLRQQIAGLE